MSIGGNYVAKVDELAKKLKLGPGQVAEIDIRHDDWCPLLTDHGPCTCDPIVSVRPRHEN